MSTESVIKILQENNAGMSARQIGDKAGISIEAVRHSLNNSLTARRIVAVKIVNTGRGRPMKMWSLK